MENTEIMTISKSEIEFAKAMSKAQGEFKIPEKRTKAFNYYYADLAEINECIKDGLSKNGLSISSDVIWGEVPLLKTTCLHVSGCAKSSTVPIFFRPTEKVNDMQALGSAITYARRYALCMLFNLAADKELDDDGVSSTSRSYASSSSRALPPTSTTWNRRPASQGATV